MQRVEEDGEREEVGQGERKRERGGGIRMREGVRRVGYGDVENRRESRYGR